VYEAAARRTRGGANTLKRIIPVLCLLASTLAVAAADTSFAGAQRAGTNKVCGDPTVSCRTSATFEPHDLPFRIPRGAIIWETEPFYAVILKSMGVSEDWDECDRHIPESERLAAQGLFPRNKVFASRCQEPGTLYYTNTAAKQRFMAVYAGRTRAEAERVLAQVKATGKFPGANVRRMRAGFNGT
jgi:hypothetical protein